MVNILDRDGILIAFSFRLSVFVCWVYDYEYILVAVLHFAVIVGELTNLFNSNNLSIFMLLLVSEYLIFVSWEILSYVYIVLI